MLTTLQKLERGSELYKGFILPKSDVTELKANGFEYNPEEEYFFGTLETEEGEIRYYEYYPANFFWFFKPQEENY